MDDQLVYKRYVLFTGREAVILPIANTFCNSDDFDPVKRSWLELFGLFILSPRTVMYVLRVFARAGFGL